jgi:hypothetical protein
MHMPWRDVSLGEGPFISTSVTVREAAELAGFAGGQAVLEIGSAFGYSAVMMALAGGQVTAIDPHSWIPGSPETMTANVAAYGVAGRVAILCETSYSAMRRLTASDLLPERAGQPVKAWVHISLADLMLLEGSSALQEQWTARVRARWAAYRAFASETGSDGGAWLDGQDAEGIACDAAMTPIVTGDVNVGALEDLVRLCVELDGRRDGVRDAAWEALEQAVIGKAVELLSGPGGLASFLRRRQLGVRLGGPSLPLDIGYSQTIPAGIRNAVILRDRHCRFPGGCNQPASACDVHHTKHKKHGGKTSTKDCVLLCFFHHQIVIHQWGWTLVLNPDGTTTAWNKDKTKILHSHGPPARAG